MLRGGVSRLPQLTRRPELETSGRLRLLYVVTIRRDNRFYPYSPIFDGDTLDHQPEELLAPVKGHGVQAVRHLPTGQNCSRCPSAPPDGLFTSAETRSNGQSLYEFSCSAPRFQGLLLPRDSRVPGSGVRGRGSGEREATASSLAGKEESSRKEDNSGQGKDGPAGAIAQGGNGR